MSLVTEAAASTGAKSPVGIQSSPQSYQTSTPPPTAPATAPNPNVPINPATQVSPDNLFGNCTSGHYCFFRDANWLGGIGQWYGSAYTLVGYTYQDCSGSCSENNSMTGDYNYNVYDAVETYDGVGYTTPMFCDSVGYGTDNVGSTYNDRMSSFYDESYSMC